MPEPLAKRCDESIYLSMFTVKLCALGGVSTTWNLLRCLSKREFVNMAVELIPSRFAQKKGSDCYYGTPNFRHVERPCCQRFYFGRMDENGRIDGYELEHIECGRYTEKMYSSIKWGKQICYVCASIYEKTILNEENMMTEITVMFQCPAQSCNKPLTFREFVDKRCCQKAYFTNDYGLKCINFSMLNKIFIPLKSFLLVILSTKSYWDWKRWLQQTTSAYS